MGLIEMVRLKERDLRLVITQGYKLSEDLFRELLEDATDYELYMDLHKVDVKLSKLVKGSKSKKDKEVDESRLIQEFKEVRKWGYMDVLYSYKNTVNRRVENNSNCKFEGITLIDLLDRGRLEGELCCFDYTRLLDWLAFEVGYATYDDTYSVHYFDEKLKQEGLFYPADMHFVDQFIPENFEKELRELYLDTSVDSNYYVRTTKKYYDYFMQDVEKYAEAHKLSKGKYIPFSIILEMQNAYLECILLYYLMIRANSAVVPFRIVSLEHGKIYFVIGENKFNKKQFKDNLSDTVVVSMLDRRFEFKPVVSFL